MTTTRGRYTPNRIIDISKDTNLAVSAPITLTDDTIGFDSTSDYFDLLTWGSGAGDVTWTFDVTGTNPIITFGDDLVTFSSDVDVVGDINGLRIQGIATGNQAYGDDTTLENLTTGDFNIAFGFSAGNAITDASNNILLGTLAGLSLTTDNNIAIGTDALRFAGGGVGVNLAIGRSALRGDSGATNTHFNNIAIGFSAGFLMDTGASNTLIGPASGADLTSGSFNTAIGANSLFLTTTATNNTAIGFDSLKNSVVGDDNVAVGAKACSGSSGSSTYRNTCIGSNAGSKLNTPGAFVGRNTMIGAFAGANSVGAINNIHIGYAAGFQQTTADNLFIIGNQLYGSTALEEIGSILYGVMSPTVANQTLRINATTDIGNATNKQNFNVFGSSTLGDNAAVDLVTVNARLISNGGRAKNTSRYTTTQAIPVTDDQIYCNGTFTVTLPTGVDGQTFRIINSGTGTITITSTENIVGSTEDVKLNAGDIIILTFETTDKWW